MVGMIKKEFPAYNVFLDYRPRLERGSFVITFAKASV